MPKKAKVDEFAETMQTDVDNMQNAEGTAKAMNEPAAPPVSEHEEEKRGKAAAEQILAPESEAKAQAESEAASTELTDEDFPENDPAPKVTGRQAFYGLNFRELDKDLSPDEQREWNAIYASYRAGSILSGRVAGVDSIKVGEQSVSCLVVFDYRIKVLIPQTEIWSDEASSRPVHILRRFLGAEVDYIVREVDREGECVVASRRLALHHRRRIFRKRNHQIGDLVDCRVLAVAPTKLLVECGGYEATLSQKNISYGTILDLREDYHPGQVVTAVYKGIENDRIDLSIKDVNPHPFDNVETRHPLHCRRVSRIMGKYAGGVFCELEKGFTCMCLYSPEQRDENFDLGDNVIIVVTKYDTERKLVYGRIVTAW